MFKEKSKSVLTAAAGLSLFLPTQMLAQSVGEETHIEVLRSGFLDPPAEARPWTWFHVMSGNMSREGITRDLESLAQVGVGGIVLFHVTQGISHGNVRFNSPEHLELITHAAAECERLGIQFSIHNADGWSSTGGPWINPEQSMKRVVWTHQVVGGGALSVGLEQPASREGYYRDIAVLAWPALEGEILDAGLQPTITASDPNFDTASIHDGNRNTTSALTVANGTRGWIQFSYDEPVEIRSLMLENSPSRNLAASLEVSIDGTHWELVETFTKRRVGKFEWVLDEAFDPLLFQHFRISADESFELGELSLSTLATIPDIHLHTSLAQGVGTQLPNRLTMAADATIDPGQIIDLTSHMDAEGQITATLSAGSWTIMRFGYTSTGATNVIASPEGTGLEVDKFSPAAFMSHFDAFLEPVLSRARAVAPNALTGVMIDSYEVGGQNWTQGYEAMFEEHFGQSIIRWLPIYTGRLVGSPNDTREMLAQIRAFNANLIRENYYQVFADVMSQNGLESIVEPYGMGPYNDVDVGATASIPAGEFWMGRETAQLNDAVSAARLYDRPIVAAEGFTSQDEVNWHFDPDMGREWGDRAWIAGVNQFMFHRFAHQANTHVMPGMTMNRYGSHFDRTQPWWEEGGAAWFEYMARGHFLLRQGHAVADVALYLGEDSPVGCPEKRNFAGRLPRGVEYDCLNADTLLARSNFDDGALVLPHGARYAMIWWPQNESPGTLALARLEAARDDGVVVALEHQGDDPIEAYSNGGLRQRIITDGPLPDFTHRLAGATHIYFVRNPDEDEQVYDLSFAADGSAVELWNPIDLTMVALPSSLDDEGRTRTSFRLRAGQSSFLIFDPSFSHGARQLPVDPLTLPAIMEVEGPWSIAFEPLYSPAGTIEIAELADLSTFADTEIRHFSGQATWQTTLEWNGEGGRIFLDLGSVESVATVRLNGVEIGTAWTAPYILEVSDHIRPGENTLEIEVATLWVNRLIGDAALEDTSGYVAEGRWPERSMVDWYIANSSPPPGPRRTFTTQDFFTAEDPLVPSGLIGPVRLLAEGH